MAEPHLDGVEVPTAWDVGSGRLGGLLPGHQRLHGVANGIGGMAESPGLLPKGVSAGIGKGEQRCGRRHRWPMMG